MKNQIKKIILGAAAILVGSSNFADASIYRWYDKTENLAVSFPDSWKTVHNQRSNGVLTVHAPGEGHFATCSISIEEDKRFSIYPHALSENIRNVALTRNYWDGFYANADVVKFNTIIDNAGLGKGFATMASLDFETVPDNVRAPRVAKRGIAFASLYNNQMITVECSAEASVYSQWHKQFLSFVKSVDFKQSTNFAYTGYYRNFLEDTILKIRGPRWTEDTYH